MWELHDVQRRASRQMLKQGQHHPLVLVSTGEGAGGDYVLLVTDTKRWNDSALGRTKVLFLLGRAFAEAEAIEAEAVRVLFFVQEMWYVERCEGEPEVEQPSQEEDRREGLGILELRLPPRQSGEDSLQIMHISEIVRSGGTVDLAPRESMPGAKSDLLIGFLAGMKSAMWSDEEFAQRLQSGRFTE